MALACLPFYRQTCPFAQHESCLRDAISATQQAIKWPSQEELLSLAWDVDAAKFRDYYSPAECDCILKEKLSNLLIELHYISPMNVATIWACDTEWDVPVPL